MSRPQNIYQQVPSIKVTGHDDLFQNYEQAAAHALVQTSKAMTIELADEIVKKRAEFIRILSFPSPRKPRTPKAKPEGK